MKPRLSDIARQTDLSVATVSRALHRSDSPNVSEETRRRVHEVARRLGYRPNLAGRSLVTGRSHTVSYWTFDAFSPYYAMVGAHISREAMRRGYVVVMNNTYDPARELEPEHHALQSSPALHTGFDGVIACDVAYPGNKHAVELRSLGIPLVGIGLNYPKDGDFVGLDLYAGAVAAVRHLMEGGCRRIAMLCRMEDGQVTSDPRARAYETTLQEAGLSPLWIGVDKLSRGPGRRVIVEALTGKRNGQIPDAIFCLNDEVAIGCYRGLCDLGIRVPDDVMLVGCDGIEDAEYQVCPISSIVSPVQKMCGMAWDFLEARMEEPKAPPRQTVLEPVLVIRESSRRG